MNSKEFKCVEILTDLIENYGLVGIKTSFEDEGASFLETIRLKEVCNQSKTKLTIKISGPEAIRDLVDATTIGVKAIVAPMIESSFALTKFINATQNTIEKTALQSIQLGVNIETITSVLNISTILNQPEVKSLYSLTIGRVDLVSSLNKDRSYVNSKEIYDMTTQCFENAKNIGLKLCIGGAISLESEDFLNSLYENRLLDKFETRYAIYDASALKNFKQGLAKGQLFEYEWLQSKRSTYQQLADKDFSRIQMIQNRINSNL